MAHEIIIMLLSRSLGAGRPAVGTLESISSARKSRHLLPRAVNRHKNVLETTESLDKTNTMLNWVYHHN